MNYQRTTTVGRRRNPRRNAIAFQMEQLEARLLLDGSGFVPADTYTVGYSPGAVIAEDFNGDGEADLAVGNYLLDNDVALLFGDSDGDFTDRVDHPVGQSPMGMAVGDFNFDSRPDLVVANELSDSVSVLYGQVGGGLTGATEYDVGLFPQSVDTADFDGDGRLDLVVSNDWDSDVTILFGQPGGFANRADYAVGSSPQRVVADDFDGDGEVDFATANHDDNTVTVYYGQGDGELGGRVEYDVGTSPRGLASGDLDGDGRVDLVATNRWDPTNGISILYGQSDGGFGGRTDLQAGDGAAEVLVRDLDNDGHLDLVTANNHEDTVSVVYGQGDGGFSEQDKYDVGANPLGLAAADFDNDGRTDIAVTNQGGNSVMLLMNTATDLVPPTATVTHPLNASTVMRDDLNDAERYIDVTYNDGGGSDVDPASITDAEAEFTLSGSAAAPVVVDGAATLVAGSTYRYTFTGDFDLGDVTVDFQAGSFADNAGNTNEASTAGFTVDAPTPAVAVNPLATNDTSPGLSGLVDDPSARVDVTVDGQVFEAANNGDGTWSIADDTIGPLAEGVYDVSVTATPDGGIPASDETSDELTIDLTSPTVAVDTLTTQDATPELTGTVDDPTAQIQVSVGGQNVAAINNGDGTWRVADDTLDWMDGGSYDVSITATDAAGNIGVDATTDELTVEIVAPTVTLDALTTNDTTPGLSGTVDNPYADVEVTVDGVAYQATNDGAGGWQIADDQIAPLADGVYDVTVAGELPNGLIGTDTTTDELTIDTIPPTVSVERLVTNDSTPTVIGEVNDPDASVSVTVNEEQYQATNDGAGGWSVTVNDLPAGIYDVEAVATDQAGNASADTTTDELIVGMGTRRVTFDEETQSAVFTDADGTTAELQVKGGNVRVTFSGAGVQIINPGQKQVEVTDLGQLRIGAIEVLGETGKIEFDVGDGGDGQITIEDVTGDGHVGKFDGSDGVLLIQGDDSGINMPGGGIGKFELAGVQGDIMMGEMTGGKMDLGVVEGTGEDRLAIVLAGDIGKFEAARMIDVDIDVGNIGKLDVDTEFVNTNIEAANLGKADLGGVQLDNGGVTFGITAENVGKVKLEVDGEKLKQGKDFTDRIGDFVVVEGVEQSVGADADADEVRMLVDAGPIEIDVLANDAWIGDLFNGIITGVSNPNFGVAAPTVDGTAVTYSPDAGFEGVDEFTYTIQVSGIIDQSTVSVIVESPEPAVTVDSLTTPDETPTLSGTVRSPAGDTIESLTVNVDGVDYSATIDGNTWTAEVTTPLADETVYDVTATATDGTGRIGADDTSDELRIGLHRQTVRVDQNTKSVVFTDGDGTQAELKVKGLLDVTFTGLNLDVAGEGSKEVVVTADEQLRIDAIDVLGETNKMQFKVSGGGDGRITIEDVTGDAVVGKLDGDRVTLIEGETGGINMPGGGIEKLEFADIRADVIMGDGSVESKIDIEGAIDNQVDGDRLAMDLGIGVKKFQAGRIAEADLDLSDASKIDIERMIDSTLDAESVKKIDAGTAFVNTDIAVAEAKNISLAGLDPDNGGDPFGVTADALSNLQVELDGDKLKWQDDFVGDGDLGDFMVTIV